MAKRKTLSPWKPSRSDQLRSISRRVPDVVSETLEVLFCGINPGLYSAAVGHHFAGPGNMFWTTLFATGFTPRLFSAFDEPEMLALNYGITNLVPRASANADDLTREEMRAGARTVRRKVLKHKPRYLAFLGLAAYRIAFEDSKAQVGLQEDKIGSTLVYLLPNPSGLNAFHQPAVLNEMFVMFRKVLQGEVTAEVATASAASLKTSLSAALKTSMALRAAEPKAPAKVAKRVRAPRKRST